MSDNNYFEFDDPTEVDSEILEEPYVVIRNAIKQTYSNANEWDYYSEIIESRINEKEIEKYIKNLPHRQDLDIKIPKVTILEFTKKRDIKELYRHIGVKPLDKYLSPPKKVFVIEGAKNSITLYPLRLDYENIEIFAELHHMSPDIIQDTLKANIVDLRLVKPENLKPRKKPNN
jgi:hypothetical protein